MKTKQPRRFCKRGHPLTPENVALPPERLGVLWCRRCQEERARRRERKSRRLVRHRDAKGAEER